MHSTRAGAGAGAILVRGLRWTSMRRTVKHDLPTAGEGYEDEEEDGKRQEGTHLRHLGR